MKVYFKCFYRTLLCSFFFITFVFMSFGQETAGQKAYAAIKDDNLASIRALVEANPNLVNEWAFGSGKYKYTLLHATAKFGRKAIAAFLIEKGADINKTDAMAGMTPLYFAAANGHLALVELFLAKGAKVNMRTIIQSTPLHAAASNGNVAIAERLLANGSELDAKDHIDMTPLSNAASEGRKEMAEFLLLKGALVNIPEGKKDLSPLHWAAINGHKDVADLLISKGANIEALDSAGDTPLHRAARAGQAELVSLLVARGANPKAKNDDGKTPAEVAMTEEIAKLLRMQ